MNDSERITLLEERVITLSKQREELQRKMDRADILYEAMINWWPKETVLDKIKEQEELRKQEKQDRIDKLRTQKAERLKSQTEELEKAVKRDRNGIFRI